MKEWMASLFDWNQVSLVPVYCRTGLVNFFYMEPFAYVYFRLHGPHCLSGNWSVLWLYSKSSLRKYANEWVELCYNKTLFIKISRGSHLAQGLYFANLWCKEKKLDQIRNDKNLACQQNLWLPWQTSLINQAALSCWTCVHSHTPHPYTINQFELVRWMQSIWHPCLDNIPTSLQSLVVGSSQAWVLDRGSPRMLRMTFSQILFLTGSWVSLMLRVLLTGTWEIT